VLFALGRIDAALPIISILKCADPGGVVSNPSNKQTQSDENTTVADLRREVAQFVHDRDWEQFHDPKNLSMAIATEAAELMEHFRWVKNDGARDLLQDPGSMAGVRDELADVLAFALAFANVTGIDIASALRDKMARNASKYPVDEYKGRY
jgi:NTP pyrophosphatase (non-canonical NTP hydrolase)